jgi:hypothetical protein
MRCVPGVLLWLALSGPAMADEAPRLADDQWPVRSTGRLGLDAGLVMRPPTALGTGLSTGLGGGLTYGRRLAWGVRAAWSSATESSLVWTVTHDDFQLRAVALLRQPAGRGTFGLRLGVGPSFVREDRIRNQGKRAGLSGSDLESTAFVVFPAGELEAVIDVHVAGPWLLTLSGGPSAILSDGTVRAGWTTLLGAGWQR